MESVSYLSIRCGVCNWQVKVDKVPGTHPDEDLGRLSHKSYGIYIFLFLLTIMRNSEGVSIKYIFPERTYNQALDIL